VVSLGVGLGQRCEAVQVLGWEIHMIEVINLSIDFVSLLNQISVEIFLAFLEKLWVSLVVLFFLGVLDNSMEHVIGIIHAQVFASALYIGL
jgi:hypothetical protein